MMPTWRQSSTRSCGHCVHRRFGETIMGLLIACDDGLVLSHDAIDLPMMIV
jgi:hypothetical protein